jgi:hypothetical protein
LTSDTIAEYCFGISENYIEAPDFNVMVLETTDKVTDNMHVTVRWPWLPKLLKILPDKIVEGIFGQGMATFHVLKRVCTSFDPNQFSNVYNTALCGEDKRDNQIPWRLLECQTPDYLP